MGKKSLKAPCPDTPENREALIKQMLERAEYVRSLTTGVSGKGFYPPFLLVVAPDKTLNHVQASECHPNIFVVAEYARGEVTLIERYHHQVRWCLPPIELRRLPRQK